MYENLHYKTVWLFPPRTGSTSVVRFFLNASLGETGAITAGLAGPWHCQSGGTGRGLVPRTVVTLVRHPYTRAVSLWRSYMAKGDVYQFLRSIYGRDSFSFEAFLSVSLRYRPLRTLLRTIGLCTYQRACFLGSKAQHLTIRHENFLADFREAYVTCFCPESRDEIPATIPLPVLSKTEGRDWYLEYCDELNYENNCAALVQALWPEDFVNFNYNHSVWDAACGNYFLTREGSPLVY